MPTQTGSYNTSMFGGLFGRKPNQYSIAPDGGTTFTGSEVGSNLYLSPEYFSGDNMFNGKQIGSVGDFLNAGGGQNIGMQPSSSIFSNFGNRLSNASIGDLGTMASGIGSIFNAYNQGQFQDKMANLYKQQYDMQKAQQDRINRRQDLTQSNYNKAMGV